MERKYKKSWILVCVCLLAALCVTTLLAACGEEPPAVQPSHFSVFVENGTGSGRYKKDTECTVSATVPAGKAFAKWTIDGETVSTENPYTFTVTQEVSLTAVVGTPHTLLVEGGKISDTTEIEAQIVEGETVSVKARSTSAKTFLYWLVEGSETQIKDNPYTFVMEKDTVVKAVFDEVCLVSVSDGTVSLPDNPQDAARSMRVKAGEDCTVTANAAPAGQKFAYWYYLDENKKEVRVSESAQYTFTVTASRKLYAKYDFYYVLTVENGHIGADENCSAADVWKGHEVTVTAHVPENMGFACWKIDGEIVSADFIYTFKMTGNTTITAEFAEHIQLVTPANDKNQMFAYPKFGSGRNTTEFDRQKNADGTRKTAFAEGVDYILYHVYTSSDADRETDAVATFKLVKDANNAAKVVTMDGSVSIGCGNQPGNYYIDNTPDAAYFAFFRAVIGEAYSETQNYYFAAQVIAVEKSIYLDSGISEIGTVSIREK